MENATKALLIAGSVLIVILLIAFGMRIFNSTSGTADQVEGTMQTTEMAMFNNKFLPYIGKNKSKTDVISLVNIVNSNNAVDSVHAVTVTVIDTTSGFAGTLIQSATNLSNLDKYQIEFETFNNGYVQNIKVTKMP